jgi:hypothetical protein
MLYSTESDVAQPPVQHFMGCGSITNSSSVKMVPGAPI